MNPPFPLSFPVYLERFTIFVSAFVEKNGHRHALVVGEFPIGMGSSLTGSECGQNRK